MYDGRGSGSPGHRTPSHRPSSSFDMAALKQPVFETLERLEREIEERHRFVNEERAAVHLQKEEQQRLREELITLRAELEATHAANVKASYGVFSCCYRPPDERAMELEARRERRAAIANYAKEAFEGADENDDRELTLEELRQIEGDNAEIVMMEADVNGDGVLSKREYVNYKIFVAKQAGKQARKAFKAADFNNDKELTLEELREIEGDMAEQVMREADVDNSGLLSKREYVDFKIRQAAHGALMSVR